MITQYPMPVMGRTLLFKIMNTLYAVCNDSYNAYALQFSMLKRSQKNREFEWFNEHLKMFWNYVL